jgi:lipoprotein-releasing system ATP-binding protein
MSEPLLEARQVHKSYGAGSQRIEVLRGVELAIAGGEALAIVGDSGVGKSTLLHVLGGLDRPDRGDVLFRGADVHAGNAQRRARYRNRHVGFVFQLHHLLPEFTALENVLLPARIGRRSSPDEREARDLLARLGLEGRADHVPGRLSGGEQQRVAIGRAIALGPEVVLADEPTGNLDPATGAGVFRLLRDLQGERGFALVLATHSERLARGCDARARLVDGRLQPLDERQTRAYFDGLGGGGTAPDSML